MGAITETTQVINWLADFPVYFDITKMGVLGGGLLFSMFVSLVQFLFVAGVMSLFLVFGMFLFTAFTPLQIFLFVAGVIVFFGVWMWSRIRTDTEEEDEDGEHHDVLYRNPFVRRTHVYG